MLSQMTIKYINALNKHGDNFDPTEWLKGEISAARGSRKHGEREAPAADREKNAGTGQRSSLPQQATPLRLAQPNDDIPRRFRSKNQEQDEISLACTRFHRHRVRCFDGTGGGSWRGGSLRGSSSLRLCG